MNFNVNMTVNWYIDSSVFSCLVLFIPYTIFFRSIDAEDLTLYYSTFYSHRRATQYLQPRPNIYKTITMLIIVIPHFPFTTETEGVFTKSS